MSRNCRECGKNMLSALQCHTGGSAQERDPHKCTDCEKSFSHNTLEKFKQEKTANTEKNFKGKRIVIAHQRYRW